MGPSLPTCGVCASSQHPASERNRIVGHPVGAQKVGIRTAADLGKNISQRQSECSANSVPPAWDPSDTLIRPEYRLGLHAARGWRTKSVACAATSFVSPDTPRHPHCASCPRFAEEPAEACRGAGADSLQFSHQILGFLPLVVPQGGTHGVLGGGAERVGWPGRQQGVRCLKM